MASSLRWMKSGFTISRNEGISFSLDYGVGDSVEKVKNGTDRIGQVILAASREAELILDHFYPGCH